VGAAKEQSFRDVVKATKNINQLLSAISATCGGRKNLKKMEDSWQHLLVKTRLNIII
jgi:hypothetical protein